jgi:transcriptional regulator with XRE-family HTH domain
VDVCQVIQQRLKELGREQRDLAVAAQVTESYISQLLTRKKAPPAADRTDIYERMDAFLKLPKGQLSAMVEAERREELKKKLAEPPTPLYREVRELVIQKCRTEMRKQMREIFVRQAFGELERLLTQKLLDVTKKVARNELENEKWVRRVAKLHAQSYEEMRTIILEFLDTDVFNISVEHCRAFLDPIIESWDIDLKTFEVDIALNRRLSSTRVIHFQFVEVGAHAGTSVEPGFDEFLHLPDLSGAATEEEIDFLASLKFQNHRPTALYYYRELQNLRDPLHFRNGSVPGVHKRRDANDIEKHKQIDSRRKAIRRWTRNAPNPRQKNGK